MKPGQFIIICLSLTAFFAPQKSEGQTISDTVNRYFKVTDFIPTYNALRVQGITGLTSGDRVMIIQMKGALIDEGNSSSFGNVTNIGSAGLYEFATICGLLSDTIVFERELINSYDFSQSVQMVYVPVYSNVTIVGNLYARPWNPLTGLGGVIAIEATGTVTMNADMDASGAGYKGGEVIQLNGSCYFFGATDYYYSSADFTNTENGAKKGEGISSYILNKEYGQGKLANGGGGSNTQNSGGAGGGNYGAGGVGGRKTSCSLSNPGGVGGMGLFGYGYSNSSNQNRIFLGGGGGAGHDNDLQSTPGGNGGGIVFIKCAELIGNNRTISVNGTQGLSTNVFNNPANEARGDGGGGGGAAGVVLLDVNIFTTTLSVSAIGANGSNAGFQSQCPGPGGGGGGGVVWSSSTLPSNVITNVTGGANGVVRLMPANYATPPACIGSALNATSGENGTLLTNFAILEGSIFNCAGVLSIESLKEWYGKRSNQSVELHWKLDQTDQLQSVQLEKRTANGDFKLVKTYQQPAAGNYSLKDNDPEFPVRYRLLLVSTNGKKAYSQQLSFVGNVTKRLGVFPNPVLDELRIQIPAAADQKVTIILFDYTGKKVLQSEQSVTRSSLIVLPVKDLMPGTYFVQLRCNNELYVAKVVKQ